MKLSTKTRDFIVRSVGEFFIVLSAALLAMLFINKDASPVAMLIVSLFLITFGIYLKRISKSES